MTVVIVFVVAFSIGAAATDWFGLESKSLLDILKGQDESSLDDIVAVVDGEEIYRSSVEAQLKSREMSLNTASVSNDFDEETAEKEIIDEKIRNIVVRKEAERLGLKADYNESYNAAAEALGIIKEPGN